MFLTKSLVLLFSALGALAVPYDPACKRSTLLHSSGLNSGDGPDSLPIPRPAKGAACGRVPSIKTNWTRPASTGKKLTAYTSVWHNAAYEAEWGAEPVLPSDEQLKSLTHIVLSFVNMSSNLFPDSFDEFVTGLHDWKITGYDQKPIENRTIYSERLRERNPKIKVLAALGGWNLDEQFREFAATPESRKRFAQRVAKFTEDHKLDGVDLDWEYPVWYGQTWRTTRTLDWCDRPNNVALTAAIREEYVKLEKKVKKPLEISVALPAKTSNMLAHDEETIPELEKVVDSWMLMTYDYVNRRDFVMGHHSGTGVVKQVVEEYKKRKMTPALMNVGVSMYAKWFNVTDVETDATAAKHIGSSMGQWTFENQTDGADLNKAGTYLFNSTIMGPFAKTFISPSWPEVYGKVLDPSWERALASPVVDQQAGASSFYDEESRIFWTWTSVDDTKKMCEDWIKDVGGMMVWAVNQDEEGAPRVKALSSCVKGAGTA